MNVSDTVNPQVGASTGKKRGCFFYGCLTVVVLFLLMVGGGYYMATRLISSAKEVVMEYSEPQPRNLPVVSASEVNFSELKERLERFKGSLDGGGGLELTLSEKQLNSIIQNGSDFSGLGDHFYLSLKEDRLIADVSIPLDAVPFLDISEGYFNGTLGLKLREQGIMGLGLYVDSVTLKGGPLPDEIIKQFSQINLLEKKGDLPEWISKIKSIVIRDGVLTLRS